MSKTFNPFVWLIATALFLISCKSAQIFDTKPISNIREEKDNYVFENDTVRIVYSFWDQQGVLYYTLQNKLNIPIYIDWKKCSFIKNGQKLDYWIDEINSKSESKSKGINYIGRYYGVFEGTTSDKTTTTSKAIKSERIMFISPHSSIEKQEFLLYPFLLKHLDDDAITETIKTHKNRDIPAKTKIYDVSNSPLIFRNFISLSTTENFATEYYIDNGFYVSKVSELNINTFDAGVMFATEKSFYIKQK